MKPNPLQELVRRRHGQLGFVAGLVLLWTGCRSLTGTPAAALVDLEGRSHGLTELSGSRGLVLVFLGVDCPISNRALPEISALSRAAESRGVQFALIYANPAETTQQVRAHLTEYALTLPAFRDPGFPVAMQYLTHVTPEVVLVTRDGHLVYRGRINDQSSALGRDRPQATRHDLAEALEAFLASGQAPGRVVPAVGCTFRSP